MQNVTFDSTGFSEQLGLYDFFNVLIYGATFICGICVINANFNEYLWNNLGIQKGLGIILLIYITGMILQEVGTFVDRKITKIYEGMNQSILKGTIEKGYKKENTRGIIKNPLLLEQYRKITKKLLADFEFFKGEDIFENEFANGYVFSICQYFVSSKGKDKKIEKLRALSSMSKTLMTCFFLLAIGASITLIFNVEMSIEICNTVGIYLHGCEIYIDKLIIMALFCILGIIFRSRFKRTMKNFLLILLGTYAALSQSDENEKTEEGEV